MASLIEKGEVVMDRRLDEEKIVMIEDCSGKICAGIEVNEEKRRLL